MSERRTFPRIFSFNLIRAEKSEESCGALVSNLSDLSESGLQCQFRGPIAQADSINMTINLMEEGLDVTTRGKVIWVKPIADASVPYAYKIGVEFVGISESDRETIRNFIENKN